MAGVYHHAQFFSVEMESHKVFFFWPSILLISVFQVARITGVSYQHPLGLQFLYSKSLALHLMDWLFLKKNICRPILSWTTALLS
jgi:hypothetical protein